VNLFILLFYHPFSSDLFLSSSFFL